MSQNHLDAIILKIAAPCNLSCSYCYEYNAGDESWRRKPKIILDQVVERLLDRIEEYQAKDLRKISLVLHGGEPLLAGYNRLSSILEKVRKRLTNEQLNLVLQTNGTLLSNPLIKLFKEYDVLVGVSLDGGEQHNKNRLDRRGGSSWSRAVKGIKILREQAPELYGGVLAVVDFSSDPVEVLEALKELSPPSIDFLQPFYNYEFANAKLQASQYSDWFVRGLSYWLSSENMTGINVRCFSEAFKIAAGMETSSDWFGSPRPNYVVIETDGSYSLLDSLKTIGDRSEEVRTLSMSIEDATLLEALNESVNLLHKHGAFNLPSRCMDCEWHTKCKGGYLATRYSTERKFDNPSIYCQGIKKVFEYCDEVIDSCRIEE